MTREGMRDLARKMGTQPSKADDKRLRDVKALIASDDGRYLSTVGRDYGVVQFSDMARTVIEATGDMATFETGGLLGERGQKGWLLGVVAGEPLMVKGGDEIRRYLLAYSGHDGRTPVTLANCATRAVCANTIASALGEQGGFKRSIRHTSNALTYVEQAKEAFKALISSYARLGKWANLAAERRLTAVEAHAVMAHAYPVPQGEAVKESAKERIEAIHGKIVDLYSELAVIEDLSQENGAKPEPIGPCRRVVEIWGHDNDKAPKICGECAKKIAARMAKVATPAPPAPTEGES